MPISKRFASSAQTIGAGVRKPVERPEVPAVERHAIRDAALAMGVVEAAAFAPVEQFAGDVGRIQLARLLILQLVHAATPASVAQRFPLATVERGQGLFPKRLAGGHDKVRIALLRLRNQAGGRAKTVKAFHFAYLVAFAASLMPVPAAAQFNGRVGQDLVKAVREEDGAKLNELLQNKPAGVVNSRADDGETPLMAAISARNEDFTGYLLNKGADPNLAGKGGEMPLVAAARLGFDTGVDFLLQTGAKVDGVNRSGETALIVAVQLREPIIVRRLLHAGADPDKADHAQGFSAREYATRDPRARDILKTINTVKPKP